MKGYDQVVQEFVEQFADAAEGGAAIVKDAAEKFRADYERELARGDECDDGILRDCVNEAEAEIRACLNVPAACGHSAFNEYGELVGYEFPEGVGVEDVRDGRVCCFCGEPLPLRGPGSNNPRPAYPFDYDNALCCGECNGMIVMPARLYSPNATW